MSPAGFNFCIGQGSLLYDFWVHDISENKESSLFKRSPVDDTQANCEKNWPQQRENVFQLEYRMQFQNVHFHFKNHPHRFQTSIEDEFLLWDFQKINTNCKTKLFHYLGKVCMVHTCILL